MNYKHIILTRFNLQYDGQSDVHIQAKWLDERFRLFEQYCLPSIVGQTHQGFDWVLLMSDATPATYLTRMEQLIAAHSNIHIELSPYSEDYNPLYKQIGERYIGKHDYLLSTRMDSDDMLANTYVEVLQQRLTPTLPTNSVLTFLHGVQWFEGHDVAFGVRYRKNHFLNFWEEKGAIRTSLGMDHTQIEEDTLVAVYEPCMWCEIVHQSNISNGYLPQYHYSLAYSMDSYPVQVRCKRSRQCGFLITEHLRFRYHQLVRHLQRIG